MDERFLQQLKKGVLELLVLQTICRGPTYGYELIAQLGSLFKVRSERDRFTRSYTGWRTTD